MTDIYLDMVRTFLRLDEAPAPLALERWLVRDGGLALTAFALEHRVGGMLHRALSCGDLRERIAPAHDEALRAAYLKATLQHAARLEWLEPLERAFTDAGVEHVRLKGMGLVGDVYADPGTRPMEDVDLLVEPRSLELAHRITLEQGFQVWAPDYLDPLAEVGGQTFHRLLVREVDGCVHLLELHWDFTQPRGRLGHVRLDIPAMIGRRRGVRPSPADTVVLLAVHIARSHFADLLSLVDLARLVRQVASERLFDEALRHARQCGALASVYGALRALSELEGPGGTVAEATIQRFRPEPPLAWALDSSLRAGVLLRDADWARARTLLIADRPIDCVKNALWEVRYALGALVSPAQLERR